MEIIEAALLWRKNWCDIKDDQEMETGCDCEICVLMRACDEYTSKAKPPL